ncbi:hypothetical protein DPQ22_02280 [Candidatus Tokpelaia sp.]|nr:hypothetical protein DPQ22_02280 [Candidatus Tokpelaia sp.]
MKKDKHDNKIQVYFFVKYYKIKPSFCAEQSRRFGQTGAPWAGSLRTEDRQAAKLSGGPAVLGACDPKQQKITAAKPAGFCDSRKPDYKRPARRLIVKIKSEDYA